MNLKKIADKYLEDTGLRSNFFEGDIAKLIEESKSMESSVFIKKFLEVLQRGHFGIDFPLFNKAWIELKVKFKEEDLNMLFDILVQEYQDNNNNHLLDDIVNMALDIASLSNDREFKIKQIQEKLFVKMNRNEFHDRIKILLDDTIN